MRCERTAKGPRHKLVAYPGELKKGEQSGFAQLARTLDRKQRPQPSLFDVPCGPEMVDHKIVKWTHWKSLSEACYVLRTKLQGSTPEESWQRYTQLTEVEAAFRTIKSELGIRPIWHQGAKRVKAHILICFLAYVLWKTLAQWMRRLGLGDGPRTVLDEMKTLKSGPNGSGWPML